MGKWVAEIMTLKQAHEDGRFEWVSKNPASVARPDGWTSETLVGVVWQEMDGGITGLPGSVEVSAEHARLIAAAPALLEKGNNAVEMLYAQYMEYALADPNKRQDVIDMMVEAVREWRKVVSSATAPHV